MENKNKLFKTLNQTPSNRYYRSIRYKTNQSATVPTSCRDQNHHQPVRTQPSTHSIKNQRNKIYSIGRINSNSRVKTIDNEQEKSFSKQKHSYLQTWNTLMQHSDLAKKLQERGNSLRVCLPSIAETGSSQFTTLDALALPIHYLKTNIKQLKKQLPKPMIELGKIKTDLNVLSIRILKSLQQIQKQGVQKFMIFKQILRTDKVQQQQKSLRFKRQCQILLQQDQNYTKLLTLTQVRLDNLQQQIFSAKPFQLTRNPELDCQFPQSYF